MLGVFRVLIAKTAGKHRVVAQGRFDFCNKMPGVAEDGACIGGIPSGEQLFVGRHPAGMDRPIPDAIGQHPLDDRCVGVVQIHGWLDGSHDSGCLIERISMLRIAPPLLE